MPRSSIRSVAFVSLGCPKNLVDSERMLGLLAADGLAVTSDPAQADAIVINTCGFLEASKQESLGEIRDAVELKTNGKCKRVIVAIPPTLTARIHYEPGLPYARDQLVQRYPQGTLTKVAAVYPTPFWRANGLTGKAAPWW